MTASAMGGHHSGDGLSTAPSQSGQRSSPYPVEFASQVLLVRAIASSCRLHAVQKAIHIEDLGATLDVNKMLFDRWVGKSQFVENQGAVDHARDLIALYQEVRGNVISHERPDASGPLHALAVGLCLPYDFDNFAAGGRLKGCRGREAQRPSPVGERFRRSLWRGIDLSGTDHDLIPS